MTAGATPPPLTLLGDGTATVPGQRGEIRLSQDRKRWWNGVMWAPTATSMPPTALRSPEGDTWWDGAEWRPLAGVRRWHEAPLVIMALHVVPFALLVAALAGGGLVIWALAILMWIAWSILVGRSRLLKPRAKALMIVLSVVGIVAAVVLDLRERRYRDTRVAASAARL